MPLTKDDLKAIRAIIKEELSPLEKKVDELSVKVEKVLKFVPIENADFDNHLNGKHKLKVVKEQKEA